ncbi:MAG TPA: DUF4624 domain-containing lipoprotein [Subdoligranulum variabile]|uniref:DUF4624 domain-containing lipoprotein n=1 Tax=Subdoligranulum variabile TaxID=214851 RepID=A0A921IM41_9FIRM|nr:DUF4624 domain-containing lipoprotein [Subdoligranulum variabile]
MKKVIILFMMLIGMTGLTACASSGVHTRTPSRQAAASIQMELDAHYDDADPFVNEKLFCVSEDLDTLTAKVTLDLEGGTGLLEIKNNKTNEVLWSRTWETDAQEETFSISLENLKKDEEYVVCFTGTGITHAAIQVTFDSDVVQEREKPLR